LSPFFTSSFSSCFSLVPSCFLALRIPFFLFFSPKILLIFSFLPLSLFSGSPLVFIGG
jgi:hypothetical protein